MPTRNVAAGLTVLGFRENVDLLLDEYYKNAANAYILSLKQSEINPDDIDDETWQHNVDERFFQQPSTDLQLIMNNVPNREWSAPKQDLVDGVLFFYLSAKALIDARRCIAQAHTHEMFMSNPQFMTSLLKSADYIEKNNRHLIGAVKVTSIAAYGSGVGFRGRNYAGIDSANFHFFENPLSLDFLKTLPLSINGPTVYSLVGDKSTRIINELRKSNTLPKWLDEMTFGDTLYSHITKDNWLSTLPSTSIVIDSSATSSPEQLLRFHFFNYLIKAVADDKSPIVEEAPHWRGRQLTGYSDYLFQVNGTWIPFEAKVNVNSERNILEQIKKYTESEAFNMTTEEEAKPFRVSMPGHRICLLGDQHGIYLTVNSTFVDCASDHPLWPRTSLSKDALENMRQRIAQYI